MNTLKFETRISDNGLIQIPNGYNFSGKDADVVVFLRDKPSISKETINEFLDKWSGFLSDGVGNDEKYDYLMEKHK